MAKLSTYQSKELRNRLSRVVGERMARWDEANKRPEAPSHRVLLAEFKKGRFTLNRARLAKDLKERGFGRFHAEDVLIFPIQAAHQAKREAWDKARSAARAKLDPLVEETMDRIIFQTAFGYDDARNLLAEFEKKVNAVKL